MMPEIKFLFQSKTAIHRTMRITQDINVKIGILRVVSPMLPISAFGAELHKGLEQ